MTEVPNAADCRKSIPTLAMISATDPFVHAKVLKEIRAGRGVAVDYRGMSTMAALTLARELAAVVAAHTSTT